ncbi:MAG: beta-1,6-N-acetylglucosaminyltransferase [Chthoniobacterales bacterium]
MKGNIRLGLLFLVAENDLRQPQGWRDFLSSAVDEIDIYCHSKQPINPDSLLSGREIREIHETTWGDFGVVLAMHALLRAAIGNPDLTHFMFVSESCIPIKSWTEIKSALAIDSRSRIDWKSWLQMNQDQRDRKATTKISKSFWVSHSTWLLLNREVVEFLLEHDSAMSMFDNIPCADEHAIGGTLLIHGFDMSKVNRTSTTWARWSGKMHPDTIHVATPELVRQWKDYPGFFARKFSSNCNVPRV